MMAAADYHENHSTDDINLEREREWFKKFAKINNYFHDLEKDISFVSPMITYDLYSLNSIHLLTSIFHWKFIFAFSFIFEEYPNIILINKINFKQKKFNNNIAHQLIFFIQSYIFFFNKTSLDVFFLSKNLKNRKERLYYKLIFTFLNNRIFINFLDPNKHNYISLSSGLFIKFFEKKKSFKKHKTVKLLLVKFLRKIFILSKIKNTILIIKKNPVNLLEILNVFNQPILHKFEDPYQKRLIEESKSNQFLANFFYLIFLNNKPYTKNRLPLKGRIKRKISRKIILHNNIID